MITNTFHTQIRSETETQSRKILVVDDENLLSFAISLELNKAGYETKTAGNGRQALDMILSAMEGEDQVPFDLLLTDINMPVMSGLELLAELQEREINIPVVIMTGNASGYQDQLASSERFGFLEKPFTPYQLVDEVRRALETRDLIMTGVNSRSEGEPRFLEVSR